MNKMKKHICKTFKYAKPFKNRMIGFVNVPFNDSFMFNEMKFLAIDGLKICVDCGKAEIYLDTETIK